VLNTGRMIKNIIVEIALGVFKKCRKWGVPQARII
jgi:hypothetical protein